MQQNLMFDFSTEDTKAAKNADDWRLDESTKERGRKGIEMARRTLASARPMAA